MTNRIYCAVFGCMNSSLTHPELKFFKLPGNSERRLQWLKLINRDDLEKKPNFAAYRICEKHFDVQDIRQSPNRKLLKRDALPLFLLPSLPSTSTASGGLTTRKQDCQTQVALSFGVDNCTQTDNAVCEAYAQTSISLSCNSPRKRKLKANSSKAKKNKTNEN